MKEETQRYRVGKTYEDNRLYKVRHVRSDLKLEEFSLMKETLEIKERSYTVSWTFRFLSLRR